MRLIADQLSLIRNERRLFCNISFILQNGEALILTGANGSGKSSFLRACLGFLNFHSGTLRLEGGLEAPLIEHCHYIGHQAHGQPLDRRVMNLSANETFVRVAGFIEIIYKTISAAPCQAAV